MKLKLFFLLLFPTISWSQNYGELAEKMYQKVHENFYDKKTNLYTNLNAENRKYSELWGLCSMMQVANEMEKKNPNQAFITNILNIIEQYYSEKKSQGGYDSYLIKLGGGDRYYDDNQWIGIALMDAYKRTKNQTYLTKSEMIYDFMMMGYDDVLGGGLYWREVDKLTKNTCSNAPGIILALQLYQANSNKKYLETATKLYDWTNRRLRTQERLFYDNVITKNDSIDKRIYSYNTGAMLQANLYFYEITQERKYLIEAQKMAQSAAKAFYESGKFIDDYWFNAVMLRALVHLYRFDNDKNRLNLFKTCTDYALKNDQNKLGLMGKNSLINLVNQAGMVEILLRLSEVKFTE